MKKNTLENAVSLDEDGELSGKISAIHFEKIVENNPDAVFIYDRQSGCITYGNQRLIDVLGYPIPEIQTLRLDTPDELIHHEDHPALLSCLEEIFSAYADMIHGHLVRCRHQDGRWRWLKVRLSVYDRDTQGHVTRLIGTAIDVSEDMAARESMHLKTRILELILNSMSEGVIVCDSRGELMLVNRSAEQMLRLDAPLTSLSQIRAALTADQDAATATHWWHQHPLVRALSGEKVTDQKLSLYDRKRELAMTLNHASAPLLDDGGKIIGAVDVFRDITEAHRALHELQRTEEHFRLLVEGTTDYAIFMLDHAGMIVSWNPGAERILGYRTSEIIGQHMSVFFTAEDCTRDEPARKLRQASLEGRAEEDSWRVRKDGQHFWCTGVTGALHDSDGKLKGFVAILRDNTERRLAEQNTFFLANHDLLTGLPNRARFLERLHEALINADRDHTRVAVLLLDLDRFKTINDTLGHHAGDQLLRLVSQRLSQCVRETDTVARLGGDEFVLILTRLKSLSSAELIAENIIRELAKPFSIESYAVNSGASVGIAFYPQDGGDSGELLQKADLAMYRAKATGRSRYRVFAPGMLTEIQLRQQQEEQLRTAVGQGDFELVYQPQIDLHTLKMRGVEALLRCRNPQLMMLSPRKIITLAEEMGLIISLGSWVVDTACRQLAHWRSMVSSSASDFADLSTLSLAINIAPAQLLADHFVTELKKTLERYALPPATLEIEITEASLVSAIQSESRVVDQLESLGVSISIDDFGAGMSSLSFLKQFPVDALKLDPALIRNLPRDHEDAAIVSAIARLASDLQIRVVAEGVENFEQLGFLRSTSCQAVQGFIFSEAIRPEKLEQLLQNRKSGHHFVH